MNPCQTEDGNCFSGVGLNVRDLEFVSWTLSNSEIVRPIEIDDDVVSLSWTTSSQGIAERAQKRRESVLLPTLLDRVDVYGRLKQAVRSAQSIVVITGAGISINAGCELRNGF